MTNVNVCYVLGPAALTCALNGLTWWGCPAQIESEFPQILSIRDSLIKYVFEPNGKKVPFLRYMSALPLSCWY